MSLRREKSKVKSRWTKTRNLTKSKDESEERRAKKLRNCETETRLKQTRVYHKALGRSLEHSLDRAGESLTLEKRENGVKGKKKRK